jgi:hypothetical protein
VASVRERIIAVLEKNERLSMDDEEDREALADALVEALDDEDDGEEP